MVSLVSLLVAHTNPFQSTDGKSHYMQISLTLCMHRPMYLPVVSPHRALVWWFPLWSLAPALQNRTCPVYWLGSTPGVSSFKRLGLRVRSKRLYIRRCSASADRAYAVWLARFKNCCSAIRIKNKTIIFRHLGYVRPFWNIDKGSLEYICRDMQLREGSRAPLDVPRNPPTADVLPLLRSLIMAYVSPSSPYSGRYQRRVNSNLKLQYYTVDWDILSQNFQCIGCSALNTLYYVKVSSYVSLLNVANQAKVYSESPLNRHYPLTVINSRVILGLVISDQKFVATPRNISRNLVQNLIRTAWESGIFHNYLVAFLLHWFKGVNPEIYLLKCLESAYITFPLTTTHFL